MAISPHVTHTEFAATLRLIGLTQRAFAVQCGLSEAAVNAWCRGRRAVPRWAWMALRGLQITGKSSLLLGVPALPWHAVLGVAIDATQQDVDAAYKRLLWRYHPDRGGSTAVAARINRAREEAGHHDAASRPA